MGTKINIYSTNKMRKSYYLYPTYRVRIS